MSKTIDVDPLEYETLEDFLREFYEQFDDKFPGWMGHIKASIFYKNAHGAEIEGPKDYVENYL